MIRLLDWVTDNDFDLTNDPNFIQEYHGCRGFVAESEECFLFIARRFTVVSDPTGTRISTAHLFSVRSYPNHCEVSDVSHTGQGLAPGQELFDAVAACQVTTVLFV